jgi:predicted acyltransferase
MSSVTFTAEAESTGLALPIRLPLQRVAAIDAFRGLTILAMVFVNTLQTARGIPAWLHHAPEDVSGMTFADVIFPAFMFIVGMSIPFATAQRLGGGETLWQVGRHVLTRTLGLLVLGVFMVNGEEFYNEDAMPISEGLWSLMFYASALLVWGMYRFPNKRLAAALRFTGMAGLVTLALLFRGGEDDGALFSPHWWGILGRIGWAYLFASGIFLLVRGRMQPLIAAIVCCILYYCIGNLESVQSSQILGLLAAGTENAVHTAIVLSGILTALLFFDARGEGLPRRFSAALLLALMLLVIGILLEPYYGISKDEATPSWALYSAAICVALFAFLYWLVDLRRADGWTRFLQPAAASPLLTYMIPNMIWAAMLTLHLQWPPLLGAGVPALVWGVVYACLILALAAGLYRMRIRLHL